MTEPHQDVRAMLRAFDIADFPYRTFGAAVSRLPRGVPGERAARRDAGGAVEPRPGEVLPSVEAPKASPAVRGDDRSPISKAAASAPATVVFWAPPNAGGSSARHDGSGRSETRTTAQTRLADIFAILAEN